MSERLKADAALVWAKETLSRVPYLCLGSGVEEEFLASAALALNTLVFCRSEMIPTRELLVIERGIAAKHGRVHTKGGTLGEDMILNTDFVMGFRDLTSAIALTFVVQAAQLEKRNLDRLLSEYPKARAAVQRRAYKLAFRKAMFLVAANARRHREASSGKLQSIERALEEVMRAGREQLLLQEQPSKRQLANNVAALAERVEDLPEAFSATLGKSSELAEVHAPCATSMPLT